MRILSFLQHCKHFWYWTVLNGNIPQMFDIFKMVNALIINNEEMLCVFLKRKPSNVAKVRVRSVDSEFCELYTVSGTLFPENTICC